MKKYLKNITPALILALIISFMLLIYEPIITYSSNIDDFWFDFKLMLPNIMFYSLILFVGLVFIYTAMYFINLLFSKKLIFYYVVLILSYIAFIFIYIQGNYLVGNLPSLNGETIKWQNYVTENVISSIIIITLLVGEIILVKKYKWEKTLKTNSYVAIAIAIMLTTSFISVLCNSKLYKEKIVAIATTKNINNASSEKNFFIFLVDAVDSMAFSKVVESNNKYSTTFDDFTYYPDTVSAYLFTRDAIPFMFSGEWNHNEKEFSEYYNEAFNNSKIINDLTKKDYEMNFYEYQNHWTDRGAETFDNIDIYNNKIDKITFLKQLTKYILYKYLPYPLKQYSHIESANFDSCKIEQESEYFDWSNDIAYNNIKNNDLNIINKNYFQFMHIEGGHTPFDYDENVNKISEEEGTYEKKLTATLEIIDSFINRLKKNNVYDNSVIVIMADHGYYYEAHGRQNPILYIKGIDEHHSKYVSDLPISYEDLSEAFIELLNDQKSENLFKNIDQNRSRKFILNEFEGEDVMVEYEQKGKAWDETMVSETGREFKR